MVPHLKLCTLLDELLIVDCLLQYTTKALTENSCFLSAYNKVIITVTLKVL
jgi:hypothetical protein